MLFFLLFEKKRSRGKTQNVIIIIKSFYSSSLYSPSIPSSNFSFQFVALFDCCVYPPSPVADFFADILSPSIQAGPGDDQQNMFVF